MDRRRMLAEALMAPAAAPVQRREFAVDPAQRVAPGRASVGNATQHFAELDTVDPTALLAQRLGMGQTVPETARLWGQATDAATNFGGTTPMQGIRAFHGSPHSFDRFSTERVGSGTGLTAFSPGIYAASDESVAAGYRRGLSAQRPMGEVRAGMISAAEAAGVTPREARQVADNVLSGVLDAGGTKRFVRRSEFPPGPLGEAYRAAASAADGARITTRGHMYEVNLNVAPDDLVRWDVPLAGQPGPVQARLSAAGLAQDGRPITPRRLEDVEALRAAGIPGLRYAAEGGTEAAPNYVMFDDSLIEIIRKYGLAGLGVGMGAAASE